MKQVFTYLRAYHPVVHSLIFGAGLISLTRAMSIVYLPIFLMKTAHLDPGTVGFIAGSGALMATFGGFIGGTLSDWLGRNRLLLICMVVLGVVFIGFTLTANPIFLFFLNSILGLFTSFFLTISKALLADLTPKEKRFRAFSNRYLASNIGFSLGPVIGTLFGVAGNPGAFLFTGFIYFAYSLILFLLLRAQPIVTSMDAINDQVSIKQSFNIILKDKALFLFIIGSVLLTSVHGEMSVTLSQYLKMNFESGVKWFGYLMSMNGLTVLTTQYMITKWSEGFKLIHRIAGGSVLFALGEIGFAFSNQSIGFMLSMIIFTFGEILIIPSEYAQIDDITPQGLRGMYYGAQGLSEFGNFIGPWFGGLILMRFGGKVMFFSFALLSLASIAFYAKGRKINPANRSMGKFIG